MNEIIETATRIATGGRIVIPVEYRRVLGLQEGDEVILSLQEGEMHLTTRRHQLRKAQAIVAQYATEDPSIWSEELITERRNESDGE
ncbi:AbrB/MazE/SpoVT family DNA-binding domain-containing protein [Crenothrix sp.]|uniref:AbrB/MazE/SpoVT family DNA-binding domain-containing protein n=1 Tax=Crenothrix sp. TaxID=3100433 RepID=UPI00374D74A3